MQAIYRGCYVEDKPRCYSCGGFLKMNFEKTVCPNCGTANRRWKPETSSA